MIQRLGKYRIIERIGRGGMGMVYKAHDPMLDRTVALKVISSDVDVTDELRARFFREAQASARLSHPNVITVFDMGEEDGQLFIVMEFLEGEELRNLIAQKRNVFLEDKLAMMIEVCDGLDYAHKRGIVHRDIKPGNIFVLRDGHVKLLDFGIARIATADAGLTRTGLVMGTLRYMSPEQARGKVDHRSDIFSVGSVFYELLTYRHAFVGEDPMEILDRLRSEDPELVSEVDPSLPPELGEIIARSLKKDPAQRFAELAHMRVELERLRRALTDEADQIRSRVRVRLEEIRDIQRALTERTGRSFEDETVPLIDDRIRVSGLSSLERETTAKVERLRQLAAKVEAVAPDYDRAIQALEAGNAEEAVQGLERIVAELPDHVHAADALTRAREAVTTARRQAEEREAAARREAEERAAAERRAAEEKARREAEERAAAEKRAAEERARQAAEQGVAALAGLRRQAEEVGASEHAATQWAAAEAKAAEARAALERAAHPEATERARAATGLYRSAVEAAQAARQALERLRARAADARRLTVAAGEKAEKATAATYAADVLSGASDRLTRGDLAFEERQYESAAQLFAEATREYDRATKAAKDAAAAESRRIETLLAQARRALGAGQWTQSLTALDEILSLPGGATHAAANELRGRAQAALEAAQRERERIAGLIDQAAAALAQGDEVRCLDVLRGVGEAPAAQEQVTELSRLRRTAEEGIARKQAEQRAKDEAARKTREEEERKAREEAARKARDEEERKAREAAEQKAREEAVRKTREEEERKAREAAEQKARAEAAQKAREEEERKAREAGEQRAKDEAARKAQEEAGRREAARREEAERARAEAARREAERAQAAMTEARKRAEDAQAARHAVAGWTTAEAKAGESRAAFDRGDHAGSVARSKEAADLYGRALEAARTALQALERTRKQAEEARKQAARARDLAEKADAATHAGPAWAAAGERQAQAAQALEREDHDAAARLFTEAGREYERATRTAREAAAAAREAAAREAAARARPAEVDSTVEIEPDTVVQERRAPAVSDKVAPVAPEKVVAPTPSRRRLLPMGIGAGAIAAAIIGAVLYFRPPSPEAPGPDVGVIAPTPPGGAERPITPPPPGPPPQVETSPPPAQLEATRREVAEAREAAVIAGAERQAATAFKAGLQKERAGDAAMKERDWTTADSRYGEALVAFIASTREATEATSKQAGAATQRRAEAQRARDLTNTARGAAETAEAPRLAAPAWAKAQESEKIAEAMFKRSDFERAASLYGEALKGYHDAEKQAGDQKRVEAAQREKDRVAGLFREAEAAARAARDRSQEAREQARAAGAETLAKEAWTAAAARSTEADRLLAAGQDPAGARQAFVDSGNLFAEAARRAKVNADLKTVADQSREKMAAEKRRARTDAQEFNGGVVLERQGTQHYQRLAFKEANDSFVAAAELFAKAARPAERPPTPPAPATPPREEVRNVLGAYVRAFETKDLTLMQKIRPGLKADEIRRLRDSFEGSKEYRVSLKVESLDVAGDEAVVRGRREDNLVSKGGQSFRNESPFVFRLKRTGDGWIIDAVN